MKMKAPTVWVVGPDGLVRPIEVEVGVSDGMVTEILKGGIKPGDDVVTNFVRKGERDFVSSFVNKVTGNDK